MIKKRRLFSVIYFLCTSAFVFTLYFSYYSKDDKALQAGYVLQGQIIDSTPFLQTTSSQSAVLMDANTGAILYSQNPDTPLPMASTTKIMTALVVLESFDLDTTVTIPKDAVGVEGSSIYLKEGEKFTVRELLYGLLLESGNDSAVALACTCAGSTEKFVQMMNEKAVQLGLKNTHFDNPHGLSSQTHYTTARELAQISAYALRYEEFARAVSTKNSYIPEGEERAGRYLSNHNKLLYMYEGAIGIKTGYTKAAGRCLVSAAKRGESTYIAVTLNDRNDWHDHMSLFDFAFENYESVPVLSQDTVFTFYCGTSPKKEVYAVCANDLYITVKKETEKAISLNTEIDMAKAYYAVPGEVIGEMNAFCGGKIISSADLILK